MNEGGYEKGRRIRLLRGGASVMVSAFAATALCAVLSTKYYTKYFRTLSFVGISF